MSDFRVIADRLCGSWTTFVCLLKQPQTLAHRASGDGRQISDSYQVVSGGGELEHPTHQLLSAVSRLAQQRHGLQPAEDLFHSFALALTDGVTRMAGGALIDSAHKYEIMEGFGVDSTPNWFNMR